MKFTTGQTISTRSICDHNCIFEAVITSRTAKSLYIKMHGHDIRRCKVYTDESGIEFVYPLGRYSMAPIFKAV